MSSTTAYGTRRASRPRFSLGIAAPSQDAKTAPQSTRRMELRVLGEGRRALRDGNAALADSLLTQARSLWRGAAYVDVAYDDFARGEAERLEELRLVALEEWAEARLRLGRERDVAPELVAAAGD